MGKLVDHFGAKVSQLSFSEKYVLHFLDNNLLSVRNLSIIQMSELINVSTATINRMCSKLSLEGFPELKLLIKKQHIDLEQNKMNGKNLIHYKENILKVINTLSLNDIKTISLFIKQSSVIYIIAVGLSKVLGEYFSRLLRHVSKHNYFIHDDINSAAHEATENDLVIIISASGETLPLISVAERMNYKKITTVSITATADNALNKISSYSVCTNDPIERIENRDISPRASIMVVIDLIIKSYLIESDK